MRAPGLFSKILGVALCVASGAASAADVWTDPFVGVRYLQRTTASPNWEIHALEVDLDAPGISFVSTTSAQRGRTTSSFATLPQVAAQAAINADFYTTGFKPVGLAAGEAVQWPDTQDTNVHGTLAFGAGGDVKLYESPLVVSFDPTWMKGVVGGQPFVLFAGSVPQNTGAFCTDRHPRTAVGLSQNERKLLMVVVDGRRPGSVGMTCMELGALLLELGAHFGMNLDGGGSTSFWMNGQIRNVPSDGSERTVANHLALRATPLTGTLKGVIFEAPDTSARLPGATVSIGGGPTVTADGTGVYEVPLAAGSWTATASHPGFASAQVTRTVVAGQIIWGSIGLSPAPDAGEPDAGVEDGGMEDAGHEFPSDAGEQETDAGTFLDGGEQDGGEQDGGNDLPGAPPAEEPGPPDAAGCGCADTSGAGGLAFLLLLGAPVVLRRQRLQPGR